MNDKKEKDFDIKEKRIQTKELFHMVAGTSSSAILAGFLVRPNDASNNKSYYARDVIQSFRDEN